MMHTLRWMLLSLALSAQAAIPAMAQVTDTKTSTAKIMTDTVQALPSCLKYTVRGVCFFLRCSLYECSIETSVRVAHFVPEAIISVYQSPDDHPWGDIGQTVSSNANKVQAKLMSIAQPDTAASTHEDMSSITVFKGADAYGNPVGMFADIMAGQTTGTANFSVPGTGNLSGFFTNEVPKLAQAWKRVPSDITQGVGSSVTGMFSNISGIFGQVKTMLGGLNSAASALGFSSGLSSPMEFAVDGGGISGMLSEGMSAGGSEYICPSAASWLTLHFQSEIDGYFWRHIIPLELMYPYTWIPGQMEVGSWGSLYPRIGEQVQQDPYRTSGVMAERVRSIIVAEDQPHIYTEMVPKKAGYITFNGRQHQWQQLFPEAQKGCMGFGSTNASPPTKERSISNSYIWNLWQDRDCCLIKGLFLFSIP
ncbi:hypothetical protein E9531_14455 [Lampropedia puyangensis]|uniref:Integrating conjugative element protein n=1 Tax=Lampropedia puyangensis TaxID=1330072 RepID=A0A4S8EVX5_9BURK|nr:TraU family protein [Lampropedia puyangensis]THT98410.1 hypothetical protein E9531_14455 [Lampropedia puyangensis]